jgi:hypothetical protein
LERDDDVIHGPPPGFGLNPAGNKKCNKIVSDVTENAGKVLLDLMQAPRKVSIPSAKGFDMEPRKLPQDMVEEGDLAASLAMENARLAWENAVLRQQQQQLVGGGGYDASQDWWVPQDPWAYNDAMSRGVYPGITVTLKGLKNASELNGESGVVEYWHAESGRWTVRLLANGEEKFVKPENLEPSFFNTYAGMGSPQLLGWPSQETQTGGKATTGARRGKRGKTNSFGSDVSTAVGSTRDSIASISGDDAEADGEKQTPHKGPRTTVMLRNIPNNYSREMLLDVFRKHGFEKSIDLIYLPIDFQTEVGLGYAFINLISEEEVGKFQDRFQGFTDWSVVSQKVCEVSWSEPLQGLQAHIDRYRNSPVMHESVPDEYRPVLFKDGVRVDFPAATKRIRAPRFRRGMRSSNKAAVAKP